MLCPSSMFFTLVTISLEVGEREVPRCCSYSITETHKYHACPVRNADKKGAVTRSSPIYPSDTQIVEHAPTFHQMFRGLLRLLFIS